jgi:ABC-type branched-subunit amino acid transport system substrate-binding protein
MRKGKVVLIIFPIVTIIMMIFLGNIFVTVKKADAQKSERTILIGIAPDMTGLYGDAWGLKAAQDYFGWVNETKYIPGIKLDILWTDTAGSLEKGLAFFKREKEAGCLVVQHATTGENVALKKLLEESQIVGLSQTVTEVPVYEPPAWNFCGIMGIKQMGRNFLISVKTLWAKEGISRSPVVGTLVWDVIVGKASSEYIKENCAQFGIKFGVETLALPTTTEFGSHFRALNEAKCDYVYVLLPSAQMGVIIRAKYDLGLTNMKLIYPGMQTSEKMWGSLADFPAEILQGVGIIDMYGHPNEGDKPGARLLKQILGIYKKNQGEDLSWRRSGSYLMFSIIQWMLTEAIKDTAARVGSENLNGADIKYSLERLKRTDGGGLIKACDFTEYPGDRMALTHFRYCDIVAAPGGAIRIPKTDWLYSDYRPPTVK